MTELILRATPLIERVMLKMKALSLRLLHALDAFAQANVRNAMLECRLRKANAR